MLVAPLLLGLACLAFGLALATNHRGFRDRLGTSPVNTAPGDNRVPDTFKAVGVTATVLGVFVTAFGVIFVIFS